MPRLTIQALQEIEQRGEKIACLSCYSYPVAKLADSLCEILLVGDSVGMVLYGMDSTSQVTLDMMIAHGRAVCSATNKAFIVIDLPFATYTNKEEALNNARKALQQTGAQAVKIEGGQEVAEIMSFLTQHNIPVMAHIGLLPQSCKTKQDLKVQGKTTESQSKLIKDVKAVTKAGAFAVVIEAVAKEAAEQICQNTDIITIGIGASENCNGQILVIDDILGSSDYTPRFAKTYTNTAKIVEKAIADYCGEVKSGKFPNANNIYKK